MVSTSIATHYRGPPCRTRYLVRRGDPVRDLVRAVEIAPASPRDKRVLLHLATGGPHMTICVRNATRPRLRVTASPGQQPEIDVALG